MNKRRLVNACTRKIRRLFSSDIRILFVAPANHHVIHIEPLIDVLELEQNVDITTIGPFRKRSKVRQFADQDEVALFDNFDLAVATDFNIIPWWLHCKTAFLGHGVGPKLNYQQRASMDEFNYSFCPCAPIFESHKQLGIECYQIGLPILDKPPILSKGELYSRFNFDPDLPLIVYAPSWSGKTKLISGIPEYLSKLESLKASANVIVSPHPNLLNPNRCDGQDFFKNTRLTVNLEHERLSTLTLCANADWVISDISSVLFESLALGKQVFFDGNEQFYAESDASDVLDRVSEAIKTLDWDLPLYEQIISDDSDGSGFINNYIYNIGNASKVFVKTLERLDLT